MKYTYEMRPLREGEKDSNLTRMNCWEDKQGIKLSSLSRAEWVDVVSHILPLTEQEAEDYLNHLIMMRG